MTNLNPLFDEVEAIFKEHGNLTGQEFLDLTNNNMPLYHAYLAYWDAIIIPGIEHEIKRRIATLENKA